MSAPKHTPGPWVVIDAEYEPSVYIERNDGSRFRVAYADHCFALFDGLVEPEWSAASHQMREANARLIASAPDLLGALRKIAEGNLGDAPWQANYEAIRAVARAAISKAEGEHQ